MEKDEAKNHYELLYIVSGKFTEDEVKPIHEKTKKLIEKKGGAITYSEEWGKKRLAYPIKHQPYGYYLLYEYDSPGEKLREINDALKITSEIIRFQIVKKSIVTEIEKAKKAADVTRKIKQEIKETKEMERPKQTKTKKVDLKDLDEKLDKILEVDDLL